MSEGRNGGAGPAGWPAGDGEMAALIRAYDRAATSLGPIEVWPQGLRTAVDICLDSGFASFVWWGPDLIQFYNDAALPIVRAKHPASFAVPAKEAWSDVWEVIGLLAERVVETGEPVLGEDMPMVPERGGLMEVAYFTFSYNALRDETGSIAGMLATAIETTEKVREAARRRESEERQAFLLELNDAIEPLSSPVGIQGDRARAGRGRQGGESREGGLAGEKGWPEDLGKRDRHRRARRGRRAHRVRQDKPRPHRAPGTGGEKERARARQLTALAEAAERERISRELHDRVAHHMGVPHQSLELFVALAETSPARAAERLGLARESTRVALDQTRALSAELKRLQNEELGDGLAAAFRTLAESYVPDGVEVDLSFSGEEPALADPIRTQAYLAMREAVRNAVEHSGCSRIVITLEVADGDLRGVVEDDGEGFDPEGVGKATPSWGVGLRFMRERAEMLGGELRVDSRPGAGTKVEVKVPLDGRRP